MRDRERRSNREVEEPESLVDEASAESFPASDPPAWDPTHAGPPVQRETQEPPAEEPVHKDADLDSLGR